MIIKIDFREKDLYEKCQHRLGVALGCSLQIETLPLGDVVICENDGTERIIIERKTLADLAASIRDGRYSEQSYRMNECCIHNHHVYYLIEGDLDKYIPGRSRVDRTALVSASITLGFFKGFSVHRTKDVSESAEWLCQLSDKLRKKGEPGYFESKDGASVPAYSEVIKRTKKEYITHQNIGEIMLAQIPNVSVTAASYVMREFGDIPSLIKTLENNPHALDAVTIEGKTGKIRHLSKTSISNIYGYLLNRVQQVEIPV